MIGGLRHNIKDNQSRICELKKRMDADQANIDSLMAAVMLGGDLGGTGAEAEAG
jgi:hypothetical protein